MLYWLCKEAECVPNKAQIKHVILRNFSGYDGFDPWKVFEQSQLTNFPSVPDKHVKIEEWRGKLCDAFKNDENACKLLKEKFLQLNENKKSENELLHLFHDQLVRGQFCNEKVQTEFESYLDQKFEEKV